MSDSYFTIAEKGQSLYKEKGSKFIGIALSVVDENEFKAMQQELKKEYHDARHVCFGFSYGLENKVEGRSDDGEPAHSAGDPILGQIHAHGLSNVAVYVIRYFGGTKLGVGGLKQAYKQAAADAIANSKVVEKKITDKIRIAFEYQESSEIMKTISEYEGSIVHQDYSDSCLLEVEIGKSSIKEFSSKLEKLEYLNVRFKVLSE